MARLRDVLERFRPVGTPGAAARPGVPADHVAELSTELEPVLALLDEVEHEAERIRQEAVREAQRCREQAREQAEALVAEATARATAVRAQAAAQAQVDAAAEWARRAEAAQRVADQIRARARERLPAVVERAVALALPAAHHEDVTT